MRKKMSKNGLTVQAVAGTNVALLAMNMSEADCRGLRGFAIHRTDHTEGEAYWLQGMRTFAETDPGLPSGTKHSTLTQPIQDFSWSDYSAKPGHKYTYRILALKGTPQQLNPVSDISIKVQTESSKGNGHNVFFNCGAAASQEFARRFGNRKPGDVGGDNDPAWAWLSRGVHEAIIEFIGRAKKGWGLRVSAYEFRLPSVLKALREAHDRGADIQIIYDAGQDFPRDENRKEAALARLDALCGERIPQPSALSHNKFIVLTKGKKAVAVLTGSTNFSDGGVFGQSNVVHVVEDPVIARGYLECWQELKANPHRSVLAPKFTSSHPLPDGTLPRGTSMIFSPRSSLDALNFYVNLAGQAKNGLFMTFAFGMNDLFKPVYRDSQAILRYGLFEQLLGPGVRADKKQQATDEMNALRYMPGNRFAVGSTLPLNRFDSWLGEKLTGLNSHVKYIHTKYMLVDPLGPDPIVVTGSANFSAASTNKNDENMIIIRGDKRVADIYLGEFMRLWDHYNFREWASKKARESKGKVSAAIAEPWHLDSTDGWWKRYYADTPHKRHREYFAG